MVPESELVVAKFGGTSVADYPAMRRSAEIILQHPTIKIVVLSASAGMTDRLVALAAGQPSASRQRLLDEINQIQQAILVHLADSSVIQAEIDRIIETMTTLSEAAALATSPALSDELLSHGELSSSLLFTELLRQMGADSRWFDIRKVLLTNDLFGKAEAEIDALSQRANQTLKPLLADSIVITQGFIGRESGGRTTTLGRGGSDYTAALLGEALGAVRIDIWTDVPGIFTTDPRIVPNAKRIKAITFEEAAEMATFGAKILHPATLLPAIRNQIPVFVGSSKNPTAGGTYITHQTPERPLFRSLAVRRRQTLLTLHSLNMLHARGFLAEVFAILARHDLSVDLITSSEVSVALTLDNTGSTTHGAALLTQALLTELTSLCRVEVEEDLALIALIGNALSQANGVAQQVFGVLSPFNIRMICYGASSYNLCFLLAGKDADRAISALHHVIFEEQPTW